ncbi:hypothetical protein [Oxalicibacterium solurbis]|uniref:hypothetical protein n=1 Tax=Oxalicibacterium solurbis TaxID=69280 RepID=UPI0016699307|nr:hypothetical protein [Oxalicibacterium solurbis]
MSSWTISLQSNQLPYSRSMVLLLLFYSLIAVSPIFFALGVHGRHLLIFSVLWLIATCIFNKRKPKKWLALSAGALFIPALISSLYWNEPRFALLPAFLFLAMLLLAQASSKEVDRYIDYASWFLIIMLTGCVIGYLLVCVHIEPVFAFQNPDGRLNYFFYTTFTNVYQGDYIRPSGIYDEPGALSFFVCAIAFARHKAGKNSSMTWVLLGLGLITFSLMHLIYLAIFFISEKVSIKGVLRIIFSLIIAAAVLFSTGAWGTFEEKLLARLDVDESGRMVGDNRSTLMLNAFRALKEEETAWIVGVGPECTFNVRQCREKWGAMIANPLDPLVSQGILLSWSYYLFILLTCACLLRGRDGLKFFAIGLLFAQRPYVWVIGYSFLAVVVVWLYFSVRSTRQATAITEIPT